MAGEEKRIFSHIICLCVSNSIVPLATIAFTAGFPIHTAFPKSLESHNILVHARSDVLKRPISLLEQTIFKTPFKQSTLLLAKGDDGDSTEETVAVRVIGFHGEAECVQRQTPLSPPGRQCQGSQGKPEVKRRENHTGGSHSGTFFGRWMGPGTVFAGQAFQIYRFPIGLPMGAEGPQCISTPR